MSSRITMRRDRDCVCDWEHIQNISRWCARVQCMRPVFRGCVDIMNALLGRCSDRLAYADGRTLARPASHNASHANSVETFFGGLDTQHIGMFRLACHLFVLSLCAYCEDPQGMVASGDCSAHTEPLEAQLLTSQNIISDLSAQVEELTTQLEACQAQVEELTKLLPYLGAPVGETTTQDIPFCPQECLFSCPDEPYYDDNRAGMICDPGYALVRVQWARSMIVLTVFARRAHLATSLTTMGRLPVHSAPQDPSHLSTAAPPARSVPEGRSPPIPSTTSRCSGNPCSHARSAPLGTSLTTMGRLPVHSAPQDPSHLSTAAPPARSVPEGRSPPIPSTTSRCSGNPCSHAKSALLGAMRRVGARRVMCSNTFTGIFFAPSFTLKTTESIESTTHTVSFQMRRGTSRAHSHFPNRLVR